MTDSARAVIANARALADAGDMERAGRAARLAWSMAPHSPAIAAEAAALMERCGEAAAGQDLLRETEELGRLHISRLPRWEPPDPPCDQLARARARHLDLMERAVSGWLHADDALQGSAVIPFDESRRKVGTDIPAMAHSMIGLRRLRHLRWAVETILADGIPGDLMECGVWRGGAVALMRAALSAHEVEDRRVWAVDSFAGLPPPDPRHPKDADGRFDFHLRPELAVPLAEVRATLQRYGLLDHQVVFLRGLFHETLPHLPHFPLALLRVDGDLYSSTMDVLRTMYDRVSTGGIVVLDDYGPVVDSQRAVLDFRRERGITAPMQAVDGDAVFWRA